MLIKEICEKWVSYRKFRWSPFQPIWDRTIWHILTPYACSKSVARIVLKMCWLDAIFSVVKRGPLGSSPGCNSCRKLSEDFASVTLSIGWSPCLAMSSALFMIHSDSKVHGANMGPTWILSAPDGPHVGPMNFAIRAVTRSSRWRHQMETFSALLAICAGNSPVPGEFPTQRPVTRSFGVFLDLRLNKRLRKQSWGWWLETLSRPLWRHCNAFGKISDTLAHGTLSISWSLHLGISSALLYRYAFLVICWSAILLGGIYEIARYCGPATPYGDTYLSQHWLKWWLVA